MKIYILILLAIIGTIIKESSCGLTQTSYITEREEHSIGGIWKSRVEWKAHWVKEWEVKKVYVPIWKKVWAPMDIREWIPLPKQHVKEQHPLQNQHPKKY